MEPFSIGVLFPHKGRVRAKVLHPVCKKTLDVPERCARA